MVDEHAETTLPTGGPPAETPLAKPWWQSRTILGLIISGLSMIANAAGLSIDAGLLTEIVTQGAAFVGLMVAWYGRINAEVPVDAAQVAPGMRLPARPARAARVRVRPDAESGPFGH